MPRAYIKYDSDGIEEWHSIEMFGDTIELTTKPRDKYMTINGDTKAVTITHKEKSLRRQPNGWDTEQNCRYYLGRSGAWVR